MSVQLHINISSICSFLAPCTHSFTIIYANVVSIILIVSSTIANFEIRILWREAAFMREKEFNLQKNAFEESLSIWLLFRFQFHAWFEKCIEKNGLYFTLAKFWNYWEFFNYSQINQKVSIPGSAEKNHSFFDSWKYHELYWVQTFIGNEHCNIVEN